MSGLKTVSLGRLRIFGSFSAGSKVYRTNQFYKEQHCSFDNEILERSNAKPIYGRGCSSVGRAVALQAIGQEFDSPQLHQFV